MKSGRAKYILLVIPVMMGLNACNDKSLYHQFRAAGSWDQEQSLNFGDSLMFQQCRSKDMDLTLFVRNNNLYPYSNLRLYIDIYLPDTCYHDYTDMILSNEKGKWTGAGWGSLFTHKKHLRKIPYSPYFSIKIRHAMQDKTLEGIQDIGIRLATP